MLDLGSRVLHLDVGHGVRAALLAEQQRVALGVVAGVLGGAHHLDQASVGVLAPRRRDALRDDAAGGVGTDVDHLGAGVGLLTLGRQRHRVELADRAIALQDHAGVLPGDGGAGLDLGPGDLGVGVGPTTLGDEVVDAADAVLVARVPVLDRRVLDLGPVLGDELDYRSMQLVLVALRGGATLEVGDVGVVLGHDERALELARVHRVDAEVRRQLHRAANALGDVAERPVGEHRRVERGKEVVPHGHDRTQVLSDQLGVILHGFGERAEDHAGLGKRFLERGGHRDRVDDGIDGHVAEHLLLVQRDPELVEHVADLRVDLVHAVEHGLLLRRCPVAD